MKAAVEKAYAKINLYLDVVNRREDGFHDIRTVMQTVSLYDTVAVSAEEADTPSVTLSVGGASVPADGRNLAARAVSLFMEETGISLAVSLTLEKHIPVAAGLAGGSADAAAAFRAMNRICGFPLSEDALCALSGKLGSDIPFCLKGGTMLCEGKGEKMTRLPSPVGLYFVVACASEYVSTPLAYGALDRAYADFDGSVPFSHPEAYDALCRFLRHKSPLPPLYNIFEEAVMPGCGGARTIAEVLRKKGASAVLMSGSGPSVFGVFKKKKQADAAMLALRAMRYRAWSVIPTGSRAEYRTELHLHTAESSPCGKLSAAEMMRRYTAQGYRTVVVTDHFGKYQFDSLSGTSWEEKIDAFLDGYRAAKEAGKKFGLTVLLGAELQFDGSPNHYLAYGVDEAFLKSNPDIFSWDIEKFYRIAAGRGIFVVQAHPYRNSCAPTPAYVDALESYNASPKHFCAEDEARVRQVAAQYRLPLTSGSDAHRQEEVCGGGIRTLSPIKNVADLLTVLRSGRYRLIGALNDRPNP